MRTWTHVKLGVAFLCLGWTAEAGKTLVACGTAILVTHAQGPARDPASKQDSRQGLMTTIHALGCMRRTLPHMCVQTCKREKPIMSPSVRKLITPCFRIKRQTRVQKLNYPASDNDDNSCGTFSGTCHLKAMERESNQH